MKTYPPTPLLVSIEYPIPTPLAFPLTIPPAPLTGYGHYYKKNNDNKLFNTMTETPRWGVLHGYTYIDYHHHLNQPYRPVSINQTTTPINHSHTHTPTPPPVKGIYYAPRPPSWGYWEGRLGETW